MGLTEPSIKGMLDDLLLEIDIGTLRYSQDFVKSLAEFFKKNGYLTEKQQSALRRIYRNFMAE